MKNKFLFIGLVLFLAFIYNIDFSALKHNVYEKYLWSNYILLAVLINLHLVFRAIRFRHFSVLLINNSITITQSFLLTSASYFLAITTPFKIGDFSRGFLTNTNRINIHSVTIMEFIADTALHFGIPIIGLLLFAPPFLLARVNILYLLFMGIVVLMFFVYKKRSQLFGLLFKIPSIKKNRESIDSLIQNLKTLFIKKSFIPSCLLFSLPSHFLYFIILHSILITLGSGIDFSHTVVAASVGMFLGTLSFIPMGLGSRDISIYGILILYGVQPEIAELSVILLRSLTLILLSVTSICYLLVITLKKSNKIDLIS